MRDVYAVYLRLDGDPGERFPRAAQLLLSWALQDDASSDSPVQLRRGARVFHDADVSWATLVHPTEPQAVWELKWHHPYEGDTALRWRIRAHVGYVGGQAWTSIRVAIQPVSLRIGPMRVETHQVDVVPRLLELGALADGLRLRPTATLVSVAEVGGLVKLLVEPSRTLPVVVVTRPNDRLPPLMDIDRLAWRLAGLAHCFLIESREATFALSDTVGKKLSVYAGGVRLYWPGFSADANMIDHPLWLPWTVREWESSGRSVPDRILATIRGVAVFRVPVPTLDRDISRAIDARRSKGIQALSANAQAADLPSEWVAELDRALEAETAASHRAEHLEQEVADLHARLDSAEQSVAVLGLSLPG